MKSRLFGYQVAGRNRQWLLGISVGVCLGFCVFLVGSSPPEFQPFLFCALLIPLFALAVGHLEKFLLALLLIELPFQIDIYLFFRDKAAAIGSIGGLNVSVATLCLTILYLIWIARSFRPNPADRSRILGSCIPLAIYLSAVCLAVFVAGDKALAAFEVFLLLQAFLLFVYIIYWVRTRERVLFVLTFLLAGLVIESLIMIGLGFLGESVSIVGLFARIDDGGRVGGTIGSPNESAAYLTLVLLPALGLLLALTGSNHKLLAKVTFLLGTIAIILTFSRGGWVGFMIAVLFFSFVAWRRRQLPGRLIAFLIVVGVLSGALFSSEIWLRVFGDDRGAAYSRIPLMELAVQVAKDNPLLGVGPNNFGTRMDEYLTPDYRNVWLYTVHNKYLLVATETGILGVLAFSYFLFTTLVRGWQTWKLGDPFLSPIALGLTAAIVGQMVHMNVDLFNGRPLVQGLCLVSALIISVHRLGRKVHASQ